MGSVTVPLVYPHYYEYSRWRWMPTSLIFLAAALKAEGYDPILVDDRFSRDRTLSILDEHIDDSALIGIGTATGSQLRNARELAAWCKKRNSSVPIVFGGPFPSARPDLMLSDPNVDAVVVGQGERWITELCKNFTEGVLDAKPISIGRLPPLPYFDVVDVREYLNPATIAVNYATSTGCVGHCGFCYWHHSYCYSRFPSPRVLADLWMLKDAYNIRNIQFDDGTFFVGSRWTMAIVDGLVDLGVTWRANARVDLLGGFVQNDWDRIAESGCHLMHIGLEHASPRILRLMGKGIDPDDCVTIVKRARRSGVGLRFHILLGNPTETLEDLETLGVWLDGMLQLDADLDYTVNWFTPYPGCAMTELAKRHGYEEPKTLEEFERLELVNYVDLPDDDRQIVKETSPWQTDYTVPWFTERFNAEYMALFREVVPERKTIETTGGRREQIYG